MEQPLEVTYCLVDPLIERKQGLDLVGERVLHLVEQVMCAGEGKGRQLELPENLVSFLHTDSLLGDLGYYLALLPDVPHVVAEG